MKVSLRMTSDPIVVTPEHSYAATAKLMKEHNIRRVPVIDKNGKLVGLVSQTDILSVSPSPATSLSIYEITTLLDELKIKQIMKKPVFVVESTCDLASAAKFMLEKKIGALPVMEGDKLVGIITETDIFKAMSEAMGADEPGHRLELTVEDQKGMLAKICAEVAKAGGNIASLAT
jgi:acetoin utilization protein AcuB